MTSNTPPITPRNCAECEKGSAEGGVGLFGRPGYVDYHSVLKENHSCEVIAFTANLGQGGELTGLEEKARRAGGG